MGELLTREWSQSVAYKSLGSWPCKPSQQYLRGCVWTYYLFRCYLPHRSLNSCRWIIYLGQRHVGSVKGERGNARQFLSIMYTLNGRSERQWFLYVGSFRCPSTLASCCPGWVASALLLSIHIQHDEAPPGQWAGGTTGWMHCSTIYPTCAISPDYWEEFRPMAKDWVVLKFSPWKCFRLSPSLQFCVCLASRQSAGFNLDSSGPLLLFYKRLSLFSTPSISLCI